MPLAIDCYNLLHIPMPPSLAGLDESRLCQLLARSRWSGTGIWVVCDGVIKPGGIGQSPVHQVELVYSGPSRCADSVIMEMVAANSAPRRLTIVSTDRQIRAAARRRRCHVVTSKQFISELLQLLSGPSMGGHGDPESHRHTALSGQEVDQWLKTFGVNDQSLDHDPLKPFYDRPTKDH